jgi:hypothetical protein
MRSLLAAVLVALALSPVVALAESYAVYGADSSFSFSEVQTVTGRRGPIVAGYVRNEGNMPASKLRLRVEQVDASGQVVATTIGYVADLVMPGGRRYFEVPVGSPTASHRVSVLSFNWVSPLGS